MFIYTLCTKYTDKYKKTELTIANIISFCKNIFTIWNLKKPVTVSVFYKC